MLIAWMTPVDFLPDCCMGTEVLGPAPKNQLLDLVPSDDRFTFKIVS